ncbi:MAG: alpha/beta fold hydrolase [Nannocystaceae bacterium]|nr:alpha/beta fold hydrolase [Nannocystaceae bacterium]
MKTDEAQTQTQIQFEADGATLFAHQQGRGRAVVVLHGGMADHRASLLALGGLASSHHLITPDVRAAGRSKWAGEMTWDRLADDVLALLDHLGLRRAVIVGLSVGTGIALRFAMRHPERVDALALVSPVYDGEALTDFQRAQFERMHEHAAAAVEDGVEGLLPLYAELPTPIRDAAFAMLRSFDLRSVAATTGFLRSEAGPITNVVELCRVAARTLVVRGGDAMHPPKLADAYVDALPLATLLESTPELRSALESWMQATPPMGLLHLLVGPVGSGKTTFAKTRVAAGNGVLFDADTWMVRMFGDDARPQDNVLGWYLERRDRCREAIWGMARDLVNSGADAYVELGLLTQAERELYVGRARAQGSSLLMHVADAPREQRREWVRARNQSGAPFTQVVPPAFFERASDAWEPLTDAERRRVAVMDVP